MKDVSRRHFLCGSASLALLPMMTTSEIGRVLAATTSEVAHSVQCKLDALLECFVHFREIEHREFADFEDLLDWQTRYDELVGAADAVRDAVRDDTPGRAQAIAIARACVPPSCESAHAYWLPVINGMSRSFAPAGYRFMTAREHQVMNYAGKLQLFEDQYHLVGELVEAVSALRDTMPVTYSDRLVLRRAIHSLNNDDIVDVAIARSKLEPYEADDFTMWARSCGRFTCDACNLWLGTDEWTS